MELGILIFSALSYLLLCYIADTLNKILEKLKDNDI